MTKHNQTLINISLITLTLFIVGMVVWDGGKSYENVNNSFVYNTQNRTGHNETHESDQVSTVAVDSIPINDIPEGATKINFYFWRKGTELYLDKGKKVFKVIGINAERIVSVYGEYYFFKDDKNLYIFQPRKLYTEKYIYRLTGIDIATFEIVAKRNWPSQNHFLIKDNKNIYDFDYDNSELSVLSSLDVVSFEQIPIPAVCPEGVRVSILCSGSFFADRNGVYNINLEQIEPIKHLDPTNTKLLEIEPVFREEYEDQRGAISIIYDQDTVYRIDYGQVLVLYPSVDLESFVAVSQEYQKDKNTVFYTGRDLVDYEQEIVEAVVVKDADPESFMILDWCSEDLGGRQYYVSDKKNIYTLGKKFPTRKDLFRILGYGASGIESSGVYTTDGDKIYKGCHGYVFSDLDPNTFEIVAKGVYIKDKEVVYDYSGRLMEGIKPDDCTEDQLSKCHPDGFVPF